MKDDFSAITERFEDILTICNYSFNVSIICHILRAIVQSLII